MSKTLIFDIFDSSPNVQKVQTPYKGLDLDTIFSSLYPTPCLLSGVKLRPEEATSS